MIDQFLWENSWTYREIVEKGLAQGREQGREQGIEQGMKQGIEKGLSQGIEKGMRQGMQQGIEKGRVELAHQVIEATIETRFPTLLSLAKSRLASLNDLPTLHKLFMTALTASSSETVEQSLLALP